MKKFARNFLAFLCVSSTAFGANWWWVGMNSKETKSMCKLFINEIVHLDLDTQLAAHQCEMFIHVLIFFSEIDFPISFGYVVWKVDFKCDFNKHTLKIAVLLPDCSDPVFLLALFPVSCQSASEPELAVFCSPKSSPETRTKTRIKTKNGSLVTHSECHWTSNLLPIVKERKMQLRILALQHAVKRSSCVRCVAQEMLGL